MYAKKKEKQQVGISGNIAKENNMKIEDLKKQLDENSKKIIDNMNKVHQNSGAIEILKDFKGDNKRLFTILIIVLFMWFSTIVYLVYVLNDTATIDDIRTQEIDGSIEYSDIINGDAYGEDKAN